jgi:hypothetical protein
MSEHNIINILKAETNETKRFTEQEEYSKIMNKSFASHHNQSTLALFYIFNSFD